MEQILTEEFAVDLDNGLYRGKLEVPCLQPVTDEFPLKIRRAAIKSHAVCIRKYSFFLQFLYGQSCG